MTSPTITVTPSTPSVGFDAEAEAVFPSTPAGPVVVTVWNETVDPPVIVGTRSFSADPYKLTFKPLVTGAHRVEVTWRSGQDSADLAFNVN